MNNFNQNPSNCSSDINEYQEESWSDFKDSDLNFDNNEYQEESWLDSKDSDLNFDNEIENLTKRVSDLPATGNFSIYHEVQSEEELNNILETNQNNYHDFILRKKCKNYTPTGWVEKHHIIPKHCGGVDKSWNIIELSFDDHTRAHELLAQTFDSKKDVYAVNWRRGLTEEVRERQRQYARTKSVFLDPKKQAVFGKLGGKAKSKKRDQAALSWQRVETQKALSFGTIWFHKPTDSIVCIPGDENLFLNNLSQKLLTKFPFAIDSTDSKETTRFRDGISKLINGKKKEFRGFGLMGVIIPSVISSSISMVELEDSLKKDKGIVEFTNSLTPYQRRSTSLESNLMKDTFWSYRSHFNKIIKVKGGSSQKTVYDLALELGSHIGVKYTRLESESIGVALRNEQINRSNRRGWTLWGIEKLEN